jgi:hypothetical protein
MTPRLLPARFASTPFCRCIAGTLLLSLATLSVQAADGGDPVTPYRPSVSSPAQLPVPGQLELELGGIHARTGGDARRTGLPYLLKLAFDDQWGVLLGGEAYVRQTDDTGVRSQGVGDTVLVLKRAWKVDDLSGFGVEAGAKLPTAKDSMGSGKTDFTLNTIYSRDLGPVHMDANLNVARLGLRDDPPGSSRTQVGMSAAFSTALSDQWGLTGELSGAHRKGADNGSQVLTAITYSPTRRLTFDAGVARSIHLSPNTTSYFAGVTLSLAKVW